MLITNPEYTISEVTSPKSSNILGLTLIFQAFHTYKAEGRSVYPGHASAPPLERITAAPNPTCHHLFPRQLAVLPNKLEIKHLPGTYVLKFQDSSNPTMGLSSLISLRRKLLLAHNLPRWTQPNPSLYGAGKRGRTSIFLLHNEEETAVDYRIQTEGK